MNPTNPQPAPNRYVAHCGEVFRYCDIAESSTEADKDRLLVCVCQVGDCEHQYLELLPCYGDFWKAGNIRNFYGSADVVETIGARVVHWLLDGMSFSFPQLEAVMQQQATQQKSSAAPVSEPAPARAADVVNIQDFILAKHLEIVQKYSADEVIKALESMGFANKLPAEIEEEVLVEGDFVLIEPIDDEGKYGASIFRIQGLDASLLVAVIVSGETGPHGGTSGVQVFHLADVEITKVGESVINALHLKEIDYSTEILMTEEEAMLVGDQPETDDARNLRLAAKHKLLNVYGGVGMAVFQEDIFLYDVTEDEAKPLAQISHDYMARLMSYFVDNA